MLAVVLAVSAALTYGASDFVGSVWSRRVGFIPVSIMAQSASAIIALAALMITVHTPPPASVVGWGAAAGLGSAVGGLALFRGFQHGQIAVVAPLSALGAGAIPVVVGLALGERPSIVAVLGVACALPAAWLVSSAQVSAATLPEKEPEVTGVLDGLVAGVGFALLFIGLKEAGSGAGLWPVALQQLTALALIGAVTLMAVARSSGLVWSWASAAGSALAGSLGAAAVLAYFVAAHTGLLALVAVITSLYPAITVLLARLLLGERIGRRRQVGLALAAIGVVLIAL